MKTKNLCKSVQSVSSVFNSPHVIARNEAIPSPPSGDLGGFSFSFFRAPITNTIPHSVATLPQVYAALTGDYYKSRTRQLRAITDPKQAKKFKAANFDYCTFSGTFTSRRVQDIKEYSYLLCIDFDNVESPEQLRKTLLSDEHIETLLLFVSPSGNGIKWLIPTDRQFIQQGYTHKQYFAAVANYLHHTYRIYADPSGSDVSRACFLCHDTDAYINPAVIAREAKQSIVPNVLQIP